MATEATEIGLPFVGWRYVIPGAFCALAIQIVLGLFGASFGLGAEGSEAVGLKALCAIWEVVTPFVALVAGSAMTVFFAGRRNALLNCFMVWCLALSAVAFYLTRDLGTVIGRAEAIGLSGASATALAGLAALLGLTGTMVGAAIGKRLTRYEFFARRGGEREEEVIERPEVPLHH